MAEHDDIESRERALRSEWRLDRLERWRKISVDPCIEKVAEMAQADEIAQRVSEIIRTREHFRMSRRQKMYAGAYALVIALLPIGIEKLLA